MKEDPNAEKFTHVGSNKDSMNHSSADICDKRPLVIEVSEGAPGNLEVTKKNKGISLLNAFVILYMLVYCSYSLLFDWILLGHHYFILCLLSPPTSDYR